MNQSVIEVKERKIVLVIGIVLIILFGAMMAICILTAEDAGMMIYSGCMFGMFMLLGIYLLCAYGNHRLKVFAGGAMEYSNSMGKKKSFHYRDIAKIEQNYVKTAMSLSLRDATGKRLAKVEGNMAGYEEFVQWLNGQQQAASEAQGDMEKLGIGGAGPAFVAPVRVQGTGKGGRIFLGIVGAIMLAAGIGTLIAGVAQMGKEPVEEEAQWFDIYAEYEGKQMVEFEMISYPFASFEYSDTQGLYFVFDAEMCAYIVCMDNERLETEFNKIYEYTFSDSVQVPQVGVVEGYAMPIEEDLKALAIEAFNTLWNEAVLTDANFEEYLGAFYLDTTYQPEAEGESALSTIFAGVFFLALAIYLFYYVTKGYQKVTKKVQEQSDLNHTEEEKQAVPNTVDLPIPRNIFATLLAVLVGAALGGVLWIFFYKLGRIAAISGWVAVMGAAWGWSKFGRREMKSGAWVLCILAGAAMIIFANYISYAWEIMEAMNTSNPGRAQFVKVLTNMPSLMKEGELWGSFVSDLAMGLLFALMAGLSGRFGRKKQKK